MASQEILPFGATGEHSYHRRCISHNYQAPFIYHIILKKARDCEIFGNLIGSARIAPGQPGCAGIAESMLGQSIAKSILRWPYDFPIVQLYRFCVMPDHVHILIRILYWSDQHLNFYIDALKDRVAARYSKMRGRHFVQDDIFEPGYCDKPLYDDRNLDALFRYIRENPHRLAMRRQFPQFFQRVRKLRIGDKEYEAYGNLFLFRNPDKIAVKISSRFSEGEIKMKRRKWLSAASEGTVLVSPFISPAEKKIRTAAEDLGANIILITHEAFPERFKPAGHDFSLCSEGRLLIISLGRPSEAMLSRRDCLQMNELAKALCDFSKQAPPE